MYKAEKNNQELLFKGAAVMVLFALVLAVLSITTEFKNIDPQANQKGISPFGGDGVTATIIRSN